jgi:tetratricopeptide (TPR) repeat protein
MAEAQQTSNPVRLFLLAMDIREALGKALQQHPDDLEVRLDLVRFHTVTPRIAGGDPEEARAQAAEIARRDAPLGHFAAGYIAYRDKDFGVARRELQEAVRTATVPSTRTLALKWLGWLSQESMQYPAAFAAFDQLRTADPSALYEIGRTAVFCTCELEKGRTALQEYVRIKRAADMPSPAMARLQLALVDEKLGDLAAARKEVATAWRLDRRIPGVKETRERLRSR